MCPPNNFKENLEGNTNSQFVLQKKMRELMRGIEKEIYVKRKERVGIRLKEWDIKK